MGADEQVSRGFRLVRLLARAMLWSQFQRIEVEGADRVPATGAVLIVANHFSSLADSMALLHASPRPASPLAKAPLWDLKILAGMLDAVGALPVYRPQDVVEGGQSGVRANAETFRVCHERLAKGGSLALFPEGVSQPQPKLMPLRTGAARIALDAGVPVAICPVGLVYDAPARGERGTLLIRFGEPIRVEGTKGFASRRAAIAGTTRRTEGALRELIAEADSQYELVQLKTLRTVWDQERGVLPPRTLAETHRRLRVFADGLQRLRQVAPEEVEALRADTDAYTRALDTAGIPADMLQGRYSVGRVVRFMLTQGPLLLLGTPLAILAAVVTWPIRKGGDILALRTFGGTEDMRAICRMAGAGFLVVVFTVLLALLVGWLWSWWAALAAVVLVPALLAFHILWNDHRRQVQASVRCFFLLAGARLRETLTEHRHAIYQRLLSASEHLD